MPARFHGTARSIGEMVGQGLPDIAAYLDCRFFAEESCKQYLREAFPNAGGAAVNAAFNFVRRAQSAAQNIDTTGRVTPDSEIPSGVNATPGNKYRYDVLLISNEGEEGEVRRRVLVYSPKRLSLDELANLAPLGTPKGDDSISFTGTTDLVEPEPFGRMQVLTMTRR